MTKLEKSIIVFLIFTLGTAFGYFWRHMVFIEQDVAKTEKIYSLYERLADKEGNRPVIMKGGKK